MPGEGDVLAEALATEELTDPGGAAKPAASTAPWPGVLSFGHRWLPAIAFTADGADRAEATSLFQAAQDRYRQRRGGREHGRPDVVAV